MTLILLNEIIKEHNIPPDVTLQSDSGWDCLYKKEDIDNE